MEDFLNVFRDSFRNQVILCTVLMITIPIGSFVYLRGYLRDLWISKGTEYTDKQHLASSLETDVDTWAALGAVFSVQCLLFCIVVVKYSGDVLDVFCRNRGHLQYNANGDTQGVRED